MSAPAQGQMDPRQQVLDELMARVPYLRHIGFRFEPTIDRAALSGVMPYKDDLIGNPMLPALHGGVIAAFLEMTAMVNLGWAKQWPDGLVTPDETGCPLPPMPKTIDLTIDFMRSGKPKACYSKARITRAGRRFATVHVDVWQDEEDRPIAQAICHFLMPKPTDPVAPADT